MFSDSFSYKIKKMCIPFFYILFAELGNNDAIVKLTGYSVSSLLAD